MVCSPVPFSPCQMQAGWYITYQHYNLAIYFPECCSNQINKYGMSDNCSFFLKEKWNVTAQIFVKCCVSESPGVVGIHVDFTQQLHYSTEWEQNICLFINYVMWQDLERLVQRLQKIINDRANDDRERKTNT